MSQRGEALAERLERGAAALVAFAESLTDAEWKRHTPPDARPVGVIVHHVATVYPVEIELAGLLAKGEPIVGVTRAAIDEMNAGHARDNAAPTKAETLALLRKSSATAAAVVRGFSDVELDRAAPVSLTGDAPLTAQFFIEDHALRHSFHHLAQMRAGLGR